VIAQRAEMAMIESGVEAFDGQTVAHLKIKEMKKK
jgi:hypothetical protein